MSEREHQKQVNFNSILLALVNMLLLIVAFFVKAEPQKLETAQDKLWQAIVPRTEIELRLSDLRGQQTRTDADLTDLRSKLVLLEISVAKMQKDKP
jgi:hypothetical protein